MLRKLTKNSIRKSGLVIFRRIKKIWLEILKHSSFVSILWMISTSECLRMSRQLRTLKTLSTVSSISWQIIKLLSDSTQLKTIFQGSMLSSIIMPVGVIWLMTNQDYWVKPFLISLISSLKAIWWLLIYKVLVLYLLILRSIA